MKAEKLAWFRRQASASARSISSPSKKADLEFLDGLAEGVRELAGLFREIVGAVEKEAFN